MIRIMILWVRKSCQKLMPQKNAQNGIFVAIYQNKFKIWRKKKAMEELH